MIALGIDIGGTKIAVGLVRPDGRIMQQATAPTPAHQGPAAILEAVRAMAEPVLAGAPEKVIGCGVGSAGVIDPETGIVSSATSSLADWAGTDLRGTLQSTLGLPVQVLNDVHAHAVAEARLGAGAGTDRMLLLALGTGIGGALVDSGRVDRGRRGASGHFGHVPVAQAAGLPCPCGRTGHLEAVASGPAILARYRAGDDQERSADRRVDAADRNIPGANRPAADHRHPPEVPDTRTVFGLAAAGDSWALSCIDDAAAAIGDAMAGLINSYDPDVVVVSGGLAYADRSWFDRIVERSRAGMIAVVDHCPIVLSQFSTDSAMVGAALWSLSEREKLA